MLIRGILQRGNNMRDGYVVNISVREDSCSLSSECMGEEPFCELNRDDDSFAVAEKILKSMGFKVEIIDECE